MTAVLEAAARDAGGPGCVVEDAEPDFERRRRVLRGAARRDVRGRLQGDPAPGQADARRERALRAEPDAGADRAGLRAARRAVRADARVPRRYDVFAAPVTQVPAFDVELEFPAEIAGVRMGSYLEWFRSCSRITVTSHPAVAVPAGFTADGLPVGLQLVGRARGEAELLRLARALRVGDGLAARPAGALGALARRSPPTAAHRAAYADAEPRPFWLVDAVAEAEALHGVVEADLCIVGGGFTGLWAALHAKALDPARDVVLLEAETAGFGASGRNGGFCVASLTHGIDNGLARFAAEMEVLERLGAGELRRAARRPDAVRHRLRLRADRRAAGADRRLPGAVDRRGARVAGALRPSRDRARRRGDARRGRTPPPTSAASGTTRAPASSTRASSRAGCARRRCASACACSSTPPSTTCATAGPVVEALTAVRAGAGAQGPARHQRLSPAAALDRAATSCRSTTTCW